MILLFCISQKNKQQIYQSPIYCFESRSVVLATYHIIENEVWILKTVYSNAKKGLPFFLNVTRVRGVSTEV